MKVIDFIKTLESIGYDENTELTFGCVDGNTGEPYDLEFNEFIYGEELDAIPYDMKEINVDIDVDASEEYLKAKIDVVIELLQGRINDEFLNYGLC